MNRLSSLTAGMGNRIGCRQRLFDGPATVAHAILDKTWRKTQQVFPFRNSVNFSIECQQGIRSGVVCLLLLCCPHTIQWIIRAIVVDAFKLMFWGRTRPHILKERNNGILPPLTDDDAPASVPGISVVMGIPRPRQHRLPNVVLGGVVQAMFFTLFSHIRTHTTNKLFYQEGT